MELSQKLKELRKKQGLTQLELAERLFVSRQAISGWEAGTSRPSTENLQSLSKLYNVPLEMLLDDEVATEPEKLPEEDRPEEEKHETEQNKARKKKRNKSLAIIISLLLILIAVVGLTHKGAGQENLELLSFEEMESAAIDISEDTIEVPMGGFD